MLNEKDIIIGKQYHFNTDFYDYWHQGYDNIDVIIIRELEDGEEVDKFDVGAMYEVKAPDGKILHAFLDELSLIKE